MDHHSTEAHDPQTSDRLGDHDTAREELAALARKQTERSDDEKNIFRFDDGDVVDYRLEPDTSFAENLEADAFGYKPITWTQLKKKFCFERVAHKFKVVGDISCKDMTHWERSKSIKLRDTDGVEGAVFFYDEESKPYFAWEDIQVGNEMEIRSPRFHRFMDMQEGMRLETNRSVGAVRKRKFTDDMRVDYGRQNKNSGNKLFAEKKYENALAAYDQALNYLEGSFLEKPQLQGVAKELAAACFLNIAAVRVAERKWNLIEAPCERALAINASVELNAKAYFRLGQAYLEQGELTAAGEKLRRAIQLAPGDPRVTEELDKLQCLMSDLKQAQTSLFSAAAKKKNSEFGFRESLLSEAPTSMEGVCNFRDLGGTLIGEEAAGGSATSTVMAIRPRLLYRSSNFLDATKEDIAMLLDPFGIKTIIDLRNNRETDSYLAMVKERLTKKEGDASSFVDYRTKFYTVDVSCSSRRKRATLSVTKRARALLLDQWPAIAKRLQVTKNSGNAAPEPPAKGSAEERQIVLQHCRVVYCVDMATRSILSLLVWWRLVMVFVLGFMFLIRLASKLVVRNTACRVGPLALYLTMLEKQQPEIRFMFEEIFSDEKSYPIVVSCSLGKDRTGVTIALLLSICGVSDETIAADYARTGAALTEELKILNRELGLRPEWSETPPSLMLDFMRNVRSKYGSAEAFLQQAGVSKEAMDRARTILVGSKRRKVC